MKVFVVTGLSMYELDAPFVAVLGVYLTEPEAKVKVYQFIRDELVMLEETKGTDIKTELIIEGELGDSSINFYNYDGTYSYEVTYHEVETILSIMEEEK